MPNPAKPTEQKRKLGNPGKRALPEPEAIIPLADGVPEPLGLLAAPGRKMWNVIWERGQVWLTESDAVVVQMLCELEDERYQLRGEVLRDTDDWRRRAGLRALDAQILDMKRALGFDPEGRRRLAIEGRAETNADDPPSLDEFRKRRQEIIAAANA